MKLLNFLALFLITGLLPAQESIVANYGHEAEIGQGYAYKDGTLLVWPYKYMPVWIKGVSTESSFEMKPSDHFSCIREDSYHQFIFNGPTKGQLSFTHKTFVYTLGMEKDKRQRVTVGRLVKAETFIVPAEYFLHIDYEIYLETRPVKRIWRTKR